MYKIKADKSFEKSLLKIVKAGLKQKYVDQIYFVIQELSLGNNLLPKYKDHKLTGELKGYRECHIQGDLLLIYKIQKAELVLILIDIGTHSELF
jgi:mRNA interferase YafQ